MNRWSTTQPIPWAFLIVQISVSVCVGAREPDFETDILPILQRSCHGCHGADQKKNGYRLDIRETAFRDDVVTQTTATFLGTTANCARCHDHKFDPIPQEDYYALQAVFSGMLKGGIAYDADPAEARERQMWTNLLADVEGGDEAVVCSKENEARVHE